MRALICLAFLLSPAPTFAQSTWFVAPGGTGDGSSSSSPLASVQAAIDLAQDGDEVEVAPGVYAESIDLSGKALRVYGRDGASQTMLDAGGTGTVARFTTGEGAATRIEGLTLQAGGGTAGFIPNQPTQTAAGGIVCIDSSPSFVACSIRDNGDPQDFANFPSIGGGALLINSNATFTNCEFLGNNAQVDGAGVALLGASSPTFEASSFRYNRTWYQYDNERGGGVFSGVDAGMLPTFEQCEFTGNAAGQGGGVFGVARVTSCSFVANEGNRGAGACSVTEVRDSVFSDNVGLPTPLQADSYGGGAYDSTLWNCNVTGNRADHGGGVASCSVYDSELNGNFVLTLSGNNYIPRGGGAFESDLFDSEISGNWCSDGGPIIPSLGGGVFGGSATRCVIDGNTADAGGGAANTDLNHCTITDNVGREFDGGVRDGSLTNSIAWYNEPAEMSGVDVSYSCTETPAGGVGNISATPQFWTTARRTDLALKPVSPCIDAGDPAAPTDADGSIADLGALPFDSTYVGTPTNFGAAKPSSAFCAPSIYVLGTPSLAAAATFTIEVTSVVPDKAGWIFWSTSYTNLPYLGGTLSLGTPFVRSPALYSGSNVAPCSGVLSHTFLGSQFGLLGVSAYQSVYAQAFYRDPGAADGTSAGISNAVEFVMLP